MDFDKPTPKYKLTFWMIISVFLVMPVFISGYVLSLNHPQLFPLDINLCIAIYSILFVYSHVFLSIFSLSDKEYLAHYKNKIFFSVIGSLLFLAFYVWNKKIGFTIFALINFYHVGRQQYGISYFFGLPKNLWFKSVLALDGFFGALFFVSVRTFKHYPQYQAYTPALSWIFIIFLLITTASVFKIQRTDGRIFFLANKMLILYTFIFFKLGEPLLIFFTYRFIHDMVAFMFNIAHDMNRNRVEAKNIFVSNLKIKPQFIPILSIAITFLLANQLLFLYTITVFHCFVESYIWKRGTPHRDHIMFEKF
jgi:hypothetical protein